MADIAAVNVVNGPVPTGVVQPQNSVSLYVGDLAPEVTENMLFDKFEAVGRVSSIRVCRDAITRRSLGYAYVNFENPLDAERALDTMNFDPIKGRPCRIMWSQRDPSVRRSGLGNIFIKSLHHDIDNKALFDTFSAFGNILSCKVVVDNEGKSRGYGFVHYETQAAADLAIQKVNGMLLNDVKVFVGPFKSKRERMDDQDRHFAQFKNVYVKNLPLNTTEEQLIALFQPFGKIQSPKMGAGFGFVCFEETDAAQKAVQALNGSMYEGKELFVTRAQKKQERIQTLRREYEKRKQEMQSKNKGVNLYVKNLDDSIDDAKLREAFEPYGNITSVHVMRDNDRKISKGFGFVTFSSADEATKAVTEMSGNMMAGNSKPLFVALFQRREERKQHLAMQMAMRQTRQPNMYQPNMPNMMGMQGMQNMYTMPMQHMGRGGYNSFNRNRPPFMQPMMPFHMQGQGQGPMAARGAPALRGGPLAGAGGRGGQLRTPKQQRFPQQGNGAAAQYRNQVRNMPMNAVAPGAMPQPQIIPQVSDQQDSVTFTAQLAAAAPEAQKQMLGERLFHQIMPSQGESAAKITGMLLEMDNSELLHLLEDAGALHAKVAEAVKVLQEHHSREQAAAAAAASGATTTN